MEKKLSARDRQALSAYLDQELSQRERRRLEKRLERESDLRAALEELREVRLQLRSLPEVRAPRNFTLTPEMVGQRSWLARWLPSFSPAPSLSWASALATLLLVVILLGDASGVLLGGVAFRAAQQGAQATPLAMTSEELAEAPQEEMAEAVQEAAPPAAPEESLPEPALESEQPRMLEGTPPLGESLEGDAAVDLIPAPLHSETPEFEAFAGMSATGEAEQSFADEGPRTPVAEEREGQFLAPTEMPLPEDGALLASEPSAGAPGLSTVLVVEILLALVALTTGLTSLYLRRSRRPL